ncbi:MAG: hypothetical protein JWN27_2404 [Candidatus Eremiobacteraeota bacterium]|nr:hypothetical protein [Candidatus Eremiobacteraeota bacterium]
MERPNEQAVRRSVIEAPRPTFLSLLLPLGAFGLVVAGWFWFTWVTNPLHRPLDGDACYGGARRANDEIAEAEMHQDVAAMKNAYADGVVALTICVNDPHRGAGHHRNYVRGLAIATKAAAEWSRYPSKAPWPSLASPGIVEY